MDSNDFAQPFAYDVFSRTCPSHTVLDTLSSKWVYLTVCCLRTGTKRHGELARKLDGISPKMLAQTLRELERDGLVHREAYAVIPPRVEYSLTPLGLQLAGLLDQIRRWSEEHVPEILAAREKQAEGRA